MNEQNVVIEINATVTVNGVEVPDANITIGSVKIGELIIPNVNVS